MIIGICIGANLLLGIGIGSVAIFPYQWNTSILPLPYHGKIQCVGTVESSASIPLVDSYCKI